MGVDMAWGFFTAFEGETVVSDPFNANDPVWTGCEKGIDIDTFTFSGVNTL